MSMAWRASINSGLVSIKCHMLHNRSNTSKPQVCRVKYGPSKFTAICVCKASVYRIQARACSICSLSHPHGGSSPKEKNGGEPWKPMPKPTSVGHPLTPMARPLVPTPYKMGWENLAAPPWRLFGFFFSQHLSSSSKHLHYFLQGSHLSFGWSYTVDRRSSVFP